jgi:hypothetical protein
MKLLLDFVGISVANPLPSRHFKKLENLIWWASSTDTNLCAIHANRVTIMERDVQLEQGHLWGTPKFGKSATFALQMTEKIQAAVS